MPTTELENPAADLDSLLSRIGKSINNEAATSANTAGLREQALQMVEKIKAHENVSWQQMLEPLLPRAQIEDAKRNAEAAAIDTQRLEAAIELLTVRAADLVERERASKIAQRYARAQEQRNEVAKEIKDCFPTLQAQCLALIEKIMRSNAEIDAVNADLPDGMPALQRPEGAARGFHDSGSYQTPASLRAFRITQSVLPSLTSADAIGWPKVRLYQVGMVDAGKGFSQPNVKSLWEKSKR